MQPVTSDQRIKRIAIVGGGTAGWTAASILARTLPTYCSITVVESTEIGTVGVGEATIPPFIDLLRLLDINEAEFVRETRATYKLGIQFRDWGRGGATYWHPFGTFGSTINRRPFFHYWHRARAAGVPLRFNDYSLCATLAEQNRFRFPDSAAQNAAAGLRYALHFDAGLVATYLRSYSERRGVARLERTVARATQRPDGLLDELVFSDGSKLQADLFIDCSGFRGVLIEEALRTGYIDWSTQLPCDRAIAVPTKSTGGMPPYTRATARVAGWQWRIPLQHRMGNGYVYSSAYLRDDLALDDLLTALAEKPLADPRLLRFVVGRRRLFWNRNCVALGLASGFLEPLESTSIQLVINGVFNLLDHFPDKSFAQPNIDSYNNELIEEIERIRDFILLHYWATQPDERPFWRYCQSVRLPDSLAQRIEHYKTTGRVRVKPRELFTDLSWFYIFEGLGIQPVSYDPLIDAVQIGSLRDILANLARSTAAAAVSARPHDSYFSSDHRAHLAGRQIISD
jgi:tryptophan halogenase